MTTRKISKVHSNLCKKGFEMKETHHTILELKVNGHRTNIYTYVSHGSNEIDDYLIGEMSRQLKMNKKDFLEFVDCTMTQDEYVSLLRKNNKLIIRSS